MKIFRKMVGGVVVIGPDQRVEIDVGNADDFRDQALQAIADSPKVVLDGSHVDFFDSAGMGALLSLKKKARENEGDLFLAGLQPSIREIFQVIGFDVVFKLFPDAEEAVREFGDRRV
jgi:anti-sigma B factor antagonist